jgi:hypothetical protein
MIGAIVLSACGFLGVGFMLWVIVALEFEINRIHKARSSFEQAMRGRKAATASHLWISGNA